MLFLLLSILCSTTIVLVFKGFTLYSVRTFPAIVVNYTICFLCAWATLGRFPIPADAAAQVWFPTALFLGLVFISGFNFVAATVQTFSVTIAAVMQKMSIVMSVTYAVVAFGESLGTFKIAGILLALLAIILSNVPDQNSGTVNNPKRSWYFLFPLLTLLTSGLIEVLFFRLEKLTGDGANLSFIAFLFGTAALLGMIKLLIDGLRRGFERYSSRELLGGIALGVPNFGSIYFLLKTLGVGWEGSVVFPVNNVAIITLSSLFAFVLFRERLSKINILGLLSAVVAILLIAMSRT